MRKSNAIYFFVCLLIPYLQFACSAPEVMTNSTQADSTQVQACESKALSFHWTKQTSPTNVSLNKVTIVSETSVWIVGEEGYIGHSKDQGKTWQQVTSPTEETLTSISFLDEKIGWIVGYSGTILKTEDGGKTWEQKPQIAETDFLAVKATTKDIAFIGGVDSTFFKTTNGGKNWVPLLNDIQADIYDFFVKKDSIIIVGSTGTAILMNIFNEDSLVMPTGTNRSIFGIFKQDEQRNYIIGAGGLFFQNNETKGWNNRSLKDFHTDLHSGAFLNKDVGFIVGKHGTFLKTTDAGKTWKPVFEKQHEDAKSQEDPFAFSEKTAFLTSITIQKNQGWVIGEQGIIYKLQVKETCSN